MMIHGFQEIRNVGVLVFLVENPCAIQAIIRTQLAFDDDWFVTKSLITKTEEQVIGVRDSWGESNKRKSIGTECNDCIS
jgi:hypothetical protein